MQSSRGNLTRLGHVKATVRDCVATAEVWGRLFGWSLHWQGPAKGGGWTVHPGKASQYLALDTPPEAPGDPGRIASGLNHVGLVVEDLGAAEARIKAAGYVTENHADYAPGRRFDFTEEHGVEIDVVSYGQGQIPPSLRRGLGLISRHPVAGSLRMWRNW